MTLGGRAAHNADMTIPSSSAVSSVFKSGAADAPSRRVPRRGSYGAGRGRAADPEPRGAARYHPRRPEEANDAAWQAIGAARGQHAGVLEYNHQYLLDRHAATLDLVSTASRAQRPAHRRRRRPRRLGRAVAPVRCSPMPPTSSKPGLRPTSEPFSLLSHRKDGEPDISHCTDEPTHAAPSQPSAPGRASRSAPHPRRPRRPKGQGSCRETRAPQDDA